MKKTTIAVVGIGVYLALAGIAQAQAPAPTKNLFVDVNFGFQANTGDFTIHSEPIIYGETAFYDSSQSFESAPFFDATVGFRVWRELSIGLGLTTLFPKSGTATVSASIPSPVFFDRRVVTNATVPDLEHKERSVSLLVMWTSPINDKIDGTVMVGPTFIKTFQDLVTGPQVPPGSQTPNFVAETQTDTSLGFSLGGDISYLVAPKIGIGFLVRYVIANADLPSVPDLKIGGFQFGGGARFRF